MSLAVYLVVTLGFAALTLGARGRPGLSTAFGLVGLVAATVAALAIDPTDVVAIGRSGLAASAYARLFLVLGSLVGLGLALAALASGTRRDAPMATLATLGIASLTLTLTDPRIAVVSATTGGLFGVWLILAPGADRAGATLGIRELRAVVVAGMMAIAATAWIGRDLTQLAAQPVVFGLAYLCFALAVAVRFGAIPFHLWAARLTDAAPETALPIITVLAPASLAIVALAWIDASIAPLLVDLELERIVVLAIAVASIVLAALAAFVQDDLEHVVGYSIVGDAGVVVLALAVLEPAGWAPARLWILVFIVTRSAFAAWAGGIRTTFGTGRTPDLGGWAIRSPILAIAFGLIVIAGVGLPGLAAFDARSSLVRLALDGPAASMVLLGTLAPLAYYGRLLVIGLGRPSGATRPADRAIEWRPRARRPDLTSPGAWLKTTWQGNRAFSGAVIAAMLGVLALATSVGAFGGPAAAAGLPAIVEGPSETFAPTPSGGIGPAPVESGLPSFQPIPTR
ncbi:MAG: NADH-quinone oxidoreductase subunit [Chloroflexota bacterium]|nr:NADH-quinone oxidoreductase subunit [Chloroflexota bacterium]